MLVYIFQLQYSIHPFAPLLNDYLLSNSFIRHYLSTLKSVNSDFTFQLSVFRYLHKPGRRRKKRRQEKRLKRQTNLLPNFIAVKAIRGTDRQT